MKKKIRQKGTQLIAIVLSVLMMFPMVGIYAFAETPDQSGVTTEEVATAGTGDTVNTTETSGTTTTQDEAVTDTSGESTTQQSVTESTTEESVVESNTETTTESTTQQTTTETAPAAAPAVSDSQTVDGITINISADEGVLPGYDHFSAVRVTSDAIKDAVNNALADSDQTVQNYVAFDITLFDADGNEIQPQNGGTVKVAFSGTGFDNPDQVDVFHMEDANSAATQVTSTETTDANEQVFDASSFSIYGAAALTAQSAATTYTLNVYYQYENGGTAAAAYSAQYTAGDTYSVNVPAFAGYTAKNGDVVINDGSSAGTLTGTINAETTITIVYYASDIAYTVTHHFQQPDSTYVTEVENKSGKVGEQTDAQPKTGVSTEQYTIQPYTNELLAAGSTGVNIDIYYSLNTSFLTFNSNGGTYCTPLYGLYGSTVNVNYTPTRIGYTFAGWYWNEDLSGSAVSGNVTLSGDKTLYAKWTPDTASYTVVYWKESLTSGQYDYGESNTYSATAGSTVNGSTYGAAKSYSYFTYDHADSNVVVNGDGSTVVNVYYRRNSYTFTFTINQNGAKLTIGGNTYTNSGTKYSFTAKYGQDVSSLWPTASNFNSQYSKNFEGWSGGSTTSLFSSKRWNVTAEMIKTDVDGATQSYKGNWREDLETVELHYWAQDANDNAYTELTQYAQTANTSNDFGAKDLDGFDKTGTPAGYDGSGWKRDDSTGSWIYVYNFYYNRKTFSIDFYNAGTPETAHDKTGIRYEQNISSFYYVPSRPSSIASYKVFAGWYTTPDCLDGTEFSFTNATMPNSNLVLYAKWAAPTVTLTFNTEGGSAIASESVTAGSEAAVPANPTKDGYTFVGWYTDDTYSTLFDFGQITADTTAYAKWATKTIYSYTVNYYLTGTTTKLAESDTLYGTINNRVWANAKAITDESGTAYIVDSPSKSVLIGADESSNVINFYYSTPHDIYYQVKYVDENGNAIRIDDPVATRYQQVIVNADVAGIQALGYTPTTSRQTKTLSDETDPNALYNNIITFTCTPNAQTYTVNYLDKASGESIHAAATKDTKFGNTILSSTEIITIPGYSFSNADPSQLKIGVDNSANVINLYYTENPAVDITYVSEDSSKGTVSNDKDTLKPATGGTIDGSTATAADGYFFVGWSVGNSADIVSTDATIGKDIVNQYAKSDGIYVATTFTAHFHAKYEVSVAANSGTFTYDGAEHTVSGLVGEADGSVAVTASNGLTYYVSNLSATASGTDVADSKSVNVTGTAVVKDADGNVVTDQFQVNTTPGALTINKAAVTLKSATLTKPYDGTALANGTTALETETGWADGEGADYAFTGTITLPGTVDNAFTYTLKSGTKADNYTISKSVGTLTVTNATAKYEVSVAANSGTFTYDGAEHTVSGLVGEADGSVAVTASNGLTYYVSNLSATASGTDVADSKSVNVTGTAVVKDADGNVVTDQFQVNTTPGALTITPAQVVVTVQPASKVAGAADPTFTATVKVTLKGIAGKLSVKSNTYTMPDGATIDYTISRPGAGTDEAVGTYKNAIVATGQQLQGNYEVSYVPADFTITAVPTYTVTYIDWDGTVLGTGTYTIGQAVTAPANPTRADDGAYTYAFNTWNLFSGTALNNGLCAGNAVYQAAYTPTAITAVTPVEPAVVPLATPPAAEVTTEQIADNATPLSNLETIADDQTPLAHAETPWCWVHWAILICMCLTAGYGLVELAMKLKALNAAQLHATEEEDEKKRASSEAIS